MRSDVSASSLAASALHTTKNNSSPKAVLAASAAPDPRAAAYARSAMAIFSCTSVAVHGNMDSLPARWACFCALIRAGSARGIESNTLISLPETRSLAARSRCFTRSHTACTASGSCAAAASCSASCTASAFFCASAAVELRASFGLSFAPTAPADAPPAPLPAAAPSSSPASPHGYSPNTCGCLRISFDASARHTSSIVNAPSSAAICACKSTCSSTSPSSSTMSSRVPASIASIAS